jgi:hypothetical protein
MPIFLKIAVGIPPTITCALRILYVYSVYVSRTALRSVRSNVLFMFHFDWTQVQNSVQISVQMIYVFHLFFLSACRSACTYISTTSHDHFRYCKLGSDGTKILTALEYHIKKRHRIEICSTHGGICIRGRNRRVDSRIILKQILKEIVRIRSG